MRNSSVYSSQRRRLDMRERRETTMCDDDRFAEWKLTHSHRRQCVEAEGRRTCSNGNLINDYEREK